MFIGVKDGHAVSVRGNPDHPVNAGYLCPKGLSEHHTLSATNRARLPAARAGKDSLERVDVATKRSRTMADALPATCRRSTARSRSA